MKVTKAMTTGFCASTSWSASYINAFNFTYELVIVFSVVITGVGKSPFAGVAVERV